MKQVRLAVIGAGNRGSAFAQWVSRNPGRAKVVAIAEPRAQWRTRMATAHDLPNEALFSDWTELLAHRPAIDAAIVTTQDRDHVAPAVALARKGVHVFVEKPLAATEAEVRTAIEAIEKTGVIFAVAHVLRYTPYTALVKEVLSSGRIGDPVSVRHFEPIGNLHFAHSYVRGNWGREETSSPLLLAKSCHDLDWLQYVMQAQIQRISSFGRLTYFHRENQPAGAAERCVDCQLVDTCTYSAPTFYGGHLASGNSGWPLKTFLPVVSPEALDEALREGKYGRCVWACDNDVVDHQVVNMEFDTGATGSFLLTAHATGAPRRTHIFGTHGELRCDGREVSVTEFATQETERIPVRVPGDETAGGGHLGGDAAAMDAFLRAVVSDNRSSVLSGLRETLISHLAVFAAERSRAKVRLEEVVF